MARPTGLEPVTHGLEGRCSIQLSYGRFMSPTEALFEWSEWRDSNPRHPAPKAGALPGCATLRLTFRFSRLPSNLTPSHLTSLTWRLVISAVFREGCIIPTTLPFVNVNLKDFFTDFQIYQFDFIDLFGGIDKLWENARNLPLN